MVYNAMSRVRVDENDGPSTSAISIFGFLILDGPDPSTLDH